MTRSALDAKSGKSEATEVESAQGPESITITSGGGPDFVDTDT